MDDLDIELDTEPFILFLPDIWKSDLALKPTSFLDHTSWMADPQGEDINLNDDINLSDDTLLRETITYDSEDDNDLNFDIDDLDESSTTDPNEHIDISITPVTSVYDLGIQQVSKSLKNRNYQREAVPTIYYTQSAWPQTTNLECWSCGCIPPERVWSIPILEFKMTMRTLQKSKYEDEIIDPSSLGDEAVLMEHTKIKQIIAKKMHGVFCHVFCMGRHIKFSDDPIVQTNKWQFNQYVKELYREWEGKELVEIPISIKPWDMKKFNGKPDGLTEQEYYDKNCELMEMYVS